MALTKTLFVSFYFIYNSILNLKAVLSFWGNRSIGIDINRLKRCWGYPTIDLLDIKEMILCSFTSLHFLRNKIINTARLLKNILFFLIFLKKLANQIYKRAIYNIWLFLWLENYQMFVDTNKKKCFTSSHLYPYHCK